MNGLRAAVSKGLPEWLAQENPDILCLQETKLQPDQYPGEVFEALGYKSYLYSAQKKGYSGVAILTKREPDHVEYGMGMEAYDNEGRFIRADFGDLSVVSVYHPSGTSGDERQAFKMVWLEDFQKYVMELQKSRPNLILCGDYNICHEPIDIHDPVRNATNSGFLPEEREWMTRSCLRDMWTLSVRFVRRNRNIPGGAIVLIRVPRIKAGELIIVWSASRYALC